jgi:hypothetical protein
MSQSTAPSFWVSNMSVGGNRPGRFAVVRISSVRSCRKFLARTRVWILHNRRWRRWQQQNHRVKMLRGFLVLRAASLRAQAQLGAAASRTTAANWDKSAGRLMTEWATTGVEGGVKRMQAMAGNCRNPSA